MSVNSNMAKWLKSFVAEQDDLDPLKLNYVLRQMGKWRSALIVNTFIQHHGLKVLHGPFAGMDYVARATEGALAPRLIGSYESELHEDLMAFAAEDLDCVIDIGCAEGYYAVGLARLMPNTVVYAHDIDERAREACAVLAAKNGVADRVLVGGLFAPADFEAFRGRRCLVMCDTEGAEDDLLDPGVSPALKEMSLIVETHGMFRPGVLQRLVQRFSASHEIKVLEQQGKTTPLPDWLKALSHMDQLMAVWEWRSGPTPWLVMRPKAA